jgi:hypothetical protein
MIDERSRFGLSVTMLVLSTLAVSAGLPADVRAPVVLLFLIWVPGSAIWELSGIREPIQFVVLAVTSSAMLASLVSLLVLYAGVWSAGLIFAIIGGITALLLLVRATRLWPLAIPIVLDKILVRVSATYRANVELERWNHPPSRRSVTR